jgi:hypothetical protein
MSSKEDGCCTCCSGRAQICQWTDAAANPLVSRLDSFGSAFLTFGYIKSCDACQKDKATCPGWPGTVKASKGKKRQRAAGSPSPRGKGKKRQQSPTPEAPDYMEYDDQAWVAAANNIVAELTRTNALLEKSIEAAEGSRAATERM